MVRRGDSGFAADVLGPRPLIGGHDAGAEILLHAISRGSLQPRRLILMPSRLHAPPQDARLRTAWRLAAAAGAVPGLDRLLTYGARAAFTPERGLRLTVRADPAARDLLRHAFADVPGNPSLARSWLALRPFLATRRADPAAQLYPRLSMPVLLLSADSDRLHPLAIAEQVLPLLPDGQLRVLPSTGFLMAYDDPVGFARELAAFCG